MAPVAKTQQVTIKKDPDLQGTIKTVKPVDRPGKTGIQFASDFVKNLNIFPFSTARKVKELSDITPRRSSQVALERHNAAAATAQNFLFNLRQLPGAFRAVAKLPEEEAKFTEKEKAAQTAKGAREIFEQSIVGTTALAKKARGVADIAIGETIKGAQIPSPLGFPAIVGISKEKREEAARPFIFKAEELFKEAQELSEIGQEQAEQAAAEAEVLPPGLQRPRQVGRVGAQVLEFLSAQKGAAKVLREEAAQKGLLRPTTRPTGQEQRVLQNIEFQSGATTGSIISSIESEAENDNFQQFLQRQALNVGIEVGALALARAATKGADNLQIEFQKATPEIKQAFQNGLIDFIDDVAIAEGRVADVSPRGAARLAGGEVPEPKKQIPPELESLAVEARKFDTAEEFVKSLETKTFSRDERTAIGAALGFPESKAERVKSFTDFFNQAKGVEVTRAVGIPGRKPAPVEVQKIEAKETPQQKIISEADKPRTKPKKLEISQEDATSFNENLQEGQFSISKTTKSGELTLRNLAQETENLIRKQGKKIPDAEIRRIRNESLLGEETIGEIVLRKRGVITDAEAIERARQLKVSTKDILDLPKGTVLNKEQVTAARQVLANEREINKNLREMAETGSGLDKETRAFVEQSAKAQNINIDDLTNEEILQLALQESTSKLKQLEIVNLALGSEAGRALQALKQHVPAIDQKMRVIWSRMKSLNKLERDAVMERLAKTDIEDPKQFIDFLDSLDNPGFFEKIAEFSTAAKLWLPTTHIVNFFGNTLRGLTDIAIKGVVSPRTIIADLAGVRTGMKVGARNFMRAMTDEGYARQLSKFIEEGGRAPAIKGKTGEAVRLPFRALGASDEIFRAVGFHRSLYRQAAKAPDPKAFLKDPPIEAVEKATNEANKMTFQEPMGEIVRLINNLRDPARFKSTTGKALSTTVRLFLPFLKTPTNIFKQAIDFSPLTFIKNFDKIKKGGEEGATAVAEGVVGTTIATYFVHLAEEGLVTGAVPKNKAERDTFYLDKQPYSIKIGDKWYSYQRLDPIATTIGIAVDLNNNYTEEGAASLVGSVIDNMKDKTYLQGLKDITDLFAGEEWERARALSNALLGGSIPTIVSGVARATDPVIRDTKPSFRSKIKSRIPFLSETLPAKIDILGEPIIRDQQGIEHLINPIKEKGEEPDPDRKRIIDEFEAVGYSTSLPYGSRKIINRGIEIELSPEEYESLSISFGKEFQKRLLLVMDKQVYKRAPLEKKVEILDRQKAGAAKFAKKMFVIKRKGLFRKGAKKAKDALKFDFPEKEKQIEAARKAGHSDKDIREVLSR